MLNKRLRLLAAPVTAIALSVSSLAVPAAAAVSLTVESGQCTAEITEEDNATVAQNYAKASKDFLEAYRKVAVAQVPELAPIIEKYNGVEVVSPEWREGDELVEEKLIAAGFGEELAGGMSILLFMDPEAVGDEISTEAWIDNETLPQTEAQVLVDGPYIGDLEVSPAAKAQILEALDNDDLVGARALVEKEMVARAVAEAGDAKSVAFVQALYAEAPDSIYDRELMVMWLVQKCADGESVNKPLSDLLPQPSAPLNGSLDLSDLSSGAESSSFGDSADGSDIGGILGIVLGLGAIGALIGGIIFWMQQQGLMR